jgi:hypothetical protein
MKVPESPGGFRDHSAERGEVLPMNLRVLALAPILVGAILIACLIEKRWSRWLALGSSESAETKESFSTSPPDCIVKTRPLFVGDQLDFRYDIPVRNPSDRQVRFTQIRQSCSCAGATKLDTMELGPGEETTLHFHIDLRARTGHQRYVCHLLEAGGAEWSYGLETILYERARFMPHNSLHFGMVNPGTEEVREITFQLRGENAQSLPQEVSFRTGSDQLRVETGPARNEEQPDGTVSRTFPVQVRLRSPQSPGLGNHFVYAEFERKRSNQHVQCGVSWNVRSIYEIRPTQAYFGNIDPASTQPVERRVSIRRTDSQPLVITAVKSPSDSVRWSVEKMETSSVATLVLQLDPKRMRGPLWGEITIETNVAMQPVLRLTVAALSGSLNSP